MKRIVPIFALLLAAFLNVTALSGADEMKFLSTGAAKELPAEEIRRVYQLYLVDGESAYFDEDGELLQGGDPTFDAIYDVLSEEAAYYVRSHIVLTGEYDENGTEIEVEYQALYSLDGTLLADWKPRRYNNAIGKLMTYYAGNREIAYLSPEEADAALWNPLTDTVVSEDVCDLQRCTDTTAVAIKVDGTVLGIIDAEGNLLPASIPFRYSQTRYGYILGFEYKTDENGEIVTNDIDRYLFDSNLNLLLSGRFYSCALYWDGIYGEYLCLRGVPDAVRSVVRLSDLETVFRVPSGMDLCEFDGEHAVLCESEEVKGTYAIYNLSGEMIAGPYDEIFTSSSYDLSDTPPDFLFAVTGETVQKIDWEGNVLAEREIENFHSIGCAGNGRYLYRITTTRNGEKDHDNLQRGILDENFDIVLEAGADTEDNFDNIVSYLGQDPLTGNPRFLAKHTAVNGQEVYCLLNENGEVLLNGISEIGYFIEDIAAKKSAVAVRCGLSIGLIDLNGNWVKEHSIFERIGD